MTKPVFSNNDSKVGKLIATYDWSMSPLGHPEAWSQPLNTVVSLMLGSRFPMFVAWGPELGFLYNDAYAEILGAKHPAALGKRFKDIWSEIWDDIYPIIAQAMEGKATFNKNLPLIVNRRGYDEQAWFTFSYSPVADESGNVAGMFCAVTETTEQVLSERHRAAEHERMRNLFQQAPGIIAILRGDNHIFEFANDSYLRLVGRSDVLDKPVRVALPELYGQGFFELLDNVFRSGEPYLGYGVPVMLQRTLGTPLEECFVDFVYQPIFDSCRKVTGIFVEGSDVTHAVRATKALQESEKQLRLLANTIPQLAWMADAEGRINWYNDRWFAYTGATIEQMEETGWEKYFHPEDLPHVVEKWHAALASRQRSEITGRIRGVSGEYRSYFIIAAPFFDASGKLVQWFGTNTDVTQLEVAQNELKAANRRKDEFLAMLAHELRNPLAPISMAADLLKLSSCDEKQIRNASNIIARQIEHLKKIVDDLLDVSRVTRGLVVLQEEILDVADIVGEAVEQAIPLMETKGQQFRMEVPAEKIHVRGDKTRLIQVFTNILNNAAKYTPHEGSITLDVKADQKQVGFSIQDDGIGISASLLPNIFDLFTQAERSADRSQGGLGLGLALVKSLVEQQNGTVVAHSEGIGKGSKFVVQLPRVLNSNTNQEKKNTMNEIATATSQNQLMIVDDNKDGAEILALLLKSAGHQVTVSYSAQEALEIAIDTSHNIFFLDIGLPDMNGYDLARQLRTTKETANSVLVALTGYGQPGDKERAIEAGFDYHLIKPVSFEAVLELLDRIKK